MIVLRVQPLTRLVVVAAHEGIEPAIEPEKEECELPFLGIGIQPAPVLQPRDRRFARADHIGELAIAQAKPACGREHGLGEDRSWLWPTLSRAKWRCHRLKYYDRFLAFARYRATARLRCRYGASGVTATSLSLVVARSGARQNHCGGKRRG